MLRSILEAAPRFRAVPDVLTPVLLGVSLGLLPGPVLAMAARAAAARPADVLRIVAGATLADAIHAALLWAGLLRFLVAVRAVEAALLVAGAALLLLIAYLSVRARPGEDARAGGFAAAFAVVVLSPLNAVWWLTVGVGLAGASGLPGIALFLAAASATTYTLANVVGAAGRLGPRAARAVAWAAAALLAAVAVRLLVRAERTIFG